MEFDDLKKIWAQPSAQDAPWNEQQLHEVLRGKSQSIISRIKRRMWFEMAITYGTIAVLAVLAMYQQSGPFRWLMVSLIGFFVVLGFYFISKVRILARFDFGADNLRNNLVSLIGKLDEFLNVYKLSSRWSLVVYYLLAVLTLFFEKGIEHVVSYVTSLNGVIFLVFFTAAMIGPIFLVNWLTHKMYGKFVDRLRKLVVEFDLPQESTDKR